MAKSDLSIDILGTAITISTDEDPEYLKKLLEKYKQTIDNVQRISGLKDPLKLAILTGFLLSDDLEKAGLSFQERGSGTETPHPEESGEAEMITLGMLSRLDEALEVSSGAETTGEIITPAVRGAIFKLQNTVKNYDWGSPEWIPALVGQKNLSRVPWAELWMGVNPLAPSRVVLQEENESGEAGYGEAPLLSALIDQEKEAFLGPDAGRIYGTLPFLFKVLAAAKPLSIQVHPNREQAEEGFDRENQAGIPLNAPNRNYRNPNHKPEIICAIEPFAALCGFRKAAEIAFLTEIISQGSEGALKAGFETLISALKEENKNPHEAFLSGLFSLGTEARQALGPFIKAQVPLLESDFPEYLDEWKLCSYLAGLYPGDIGIIAPLYLNIIELEPGEAMYLPAGVFHSYIHGMGMELMADSDNVLRGGLTPKYTDPAELLNIINFSEYTPEILRVPSPAPSWFSYPTPAEEFTLSVMHGQGNSISYPETGPSIVFITEGSAVVTEPEAVPGNGAEMVLSKGESVFIPAGENRRLVFSGAFTAYAAAY